MPLKGGDRGLAFERQVLFEDSESRREAGFGIAQSAIECCFQLNLRSCASL